MRRNLAWVVVGAVVVVLGSAIAGISIYAQNKVDALRADKADLVRENRGLDAHTDTIREERDKQSERADTAESELKKLQDEIDDRLAELDERETGLDERESELETVSNDLDERKEGLDQREDQISGEEKRIEENSFGGNGTYVVSSDIKPGTYSSEPSKNDIFENCYWARLSSTDGDFGSIIANGNSQGPVTVTIKESDKAFETSGCVKWTLVE